MPDLTRLESSQPVQLVDANDLQVCDISTVAPSGTESGLIVRNIPSGTQAVSGTVTATPIGTYTVAGTVTAVPSGTQAVSGTVTATPSGTQAVSGTVTATPIGTYTVAGTVTAVPSGTYTVDHLGSASATLTNVTVSSGASIQLLAANGNRLLATFFNSGVDSVYIKWGTAASSTSHTIELFTGGFYEMHVPVYKGAIEARSSTGSNIIRVTEI